MDILATFPTQSEFEEAKDLLDKLDIPYQLISPTPAYKFVGITSITINPKMRSRMIEEKKNNFIVSGWIDYRPSIIKVPNHLPPHFAQDLFSGLSIAVLAPCVADKTKIKIVAHTACDLSPVFPYMNSKITNARYNPDGQTFTFMEEYRLISLHSRRITIAKPDEIVDAWRLLEKLRCMVNNIWSQRKEIKPSYKMRIKPAALEIYKCLPRTNCKLCGELTCMAFAMNLWSGKTNPMLCKPLFTKEYKHLEGPLREMLVE